MYTMQHLLGLQQKIAKPCPPPWVFERNKPTHSSFVCTAMEEKGFRKTGGQHPLQSLTNSTQPTIPRCLFRHKVGLYSPESGCKSTVYISPIYPAANTTVSMHSFPTQRKCTPRSITAAQHSKIINTLFILALRREHAMKCLNESSRAQDSQNLAVPSGFPNLDRCLFDHPSRQCHGKSCNPFLPITPYR